MGKPVEKTVKRLEWGVVFHNKQNKPHACVCVFVLFIYLQIVFEKIVGSELDKQFTAILVCRIEPAVVWTKKISQLTCSCF